MKAATPTRKDGLFGFNANTTDFNTIRIENNVIEISAENPRPLMRNEASYGAHIFNNNLKNVSDTDKYENLRPMPRSVRLSRSYFGVASMASI